MRCVRATPTAVGLWQGTELWPLGLELSQAGPGLIGLWGCHFAPIAFTPQTPDGRRSGLGDQLEIQNPLGARPEMGQGARAAPAGAPEVPHGENFLRARQSRDAHARCAAPCTSIVDLHQGTPNHWMAVPGLDAPRHDILTPLFPYRQFQDQQYPSPVADVACLTAGKARKCRKCQKKQPMAGMCFFLVHDPSDRRTRPGTARWP